MYLLLGKLQPLEKNKGVQYSTIRWSAMYCTKLPNYFREEDNSTHFPFIKVIFFSMPLILHIFPTDWINFLSPSRGGGKELIYISLHNCTVQYCTLFLFIADCFVLYCTCLVLCFVVMHWANILFSFFFIFKPQIGQKTWITPFGDLYLPLIDTITQPILSFIIHFTQ